MPADSSDPSDKVIADVTEILRPQLGDGSTAVARAVADALARRQPLRVALLGTDVDKLAKGLRRLLATIRVTAVDTHLGPSEVHVLLSAKGPFDLIVDMTAAPPSESVSTFRRVFLHLAGRGVYVTSSTGDRGVVELAVRARQTPFDSSDPVETRDLAALGRLISGVSSANGWASITSARRVRPKLRDDETIAVLARRPAIGRTIVSMPGGEFRSRCDYIDNSSEVENFRDPYRYETFSVPALHLKRYEGPICARGQIVQARGLLVADTFRHHHQPRLTNIYINDVAPNFGDVRADIRQPLAMAGAYFHFDSEWPGHFGHTVTEQISRLWGFSAVQRAEPGVKLLTTLPRGRESQHLLPWEIDLLGAFDIRESDVEIFDSPVRPERLYAATPMFSCPWYVHPEIISIWDRIGDSLMKSAPKGALPHRLFCSRRPELKRSCRNATEVEDLFRRRGFEIVHPEDHSLAEQVSMFRSADVIAGFAGSALFNTAFCLDNKPVIMISPTSYTARNEYLFASVRGHNLVTVWVRPDVDHPPGRWTTEAFSSSFVVDMAKEGRFLEHSLENLGCHGGVIR